MRKILFFIIILLSVSIVGGHYPLTTHTSKDTALDMSDADVLLEEIKWNSMSEEEQNKWFDSMNAKGEGIIIRGADRNYDTIIDHIQYFYTTDN